MSERPTKKIFISVSSDTYEEGSRVVAVVEKLDREFSRNFRVQSVLWTSEPLLATEHFQTNLKPHDTDIVVVILWSRIGTLLPLDDFPGPITGGQVTGIEWEFEDAVASYEKNQRPDLLLYRKSAPVMTSLEDDVALEQQRQQKRGVVDFIQR